MAGGGVHVFSRLKIDKKYVKKYDFAWGGQMPPPKQNLKRRAWISDIQGSKIDSLYFDIYSKDFNFLCTDDENILYADDACLVYVRDKFSK